MTRPARTSSRTTWALVPAAGLVLLIAALLGTLPDPAASSATPALGEVLGPGPGAVTEADGVLPEGATVFDDGYPGIANLDADLLQALQDAATDAADDGVEFLVNDGWRSAAYQRELQREAVAEYGSEAEAARWVASPEKSEHVSGDAVDIGPTDATSWLSQHGAAYGLCQVYANEMWHYELRPQAVDEGCPAQYADPTEDPRMSS